MKKVNFFCYNRVKPLLIFEWEGMHTLVYGCCNVFSKMAVNMAMKMSCCTNKSQLMILYDVEINNVSPARICVIYPIFNLESYKLFTGLYVF